jgi:hypothetical protein
LDAVGGEDSVERGGEFAVAVADQVLEPVRLAAEIHQEVPGALGHPRPVRVGGDAEQPDSPGGEAKVLIDSGLATTPDEARRHLEFLTLQVAVGTELLGNDPAAQAALATIVNAGRRAFLGGVEVVLNKGRRPLCGVGSGDDREHAGPSLWRSRRR